MFYVFQQGNERNNLKIEQNVENKDRLVFTDALWNLPIVNRSGN